MTDRNSRLVYSTECVVPRKEKPADRTSATPAAPAKCRTVVRLDRKGRGGRSVTVIEGLQLSAEDSDNLLKQFKAKFGTGVAVKNNALEIQRSKSRETIAMRSQPSCAELDTGRSVRVDKDQSAVADHQRSLFPGGK